MNSFASRLRIVFGVVVAAVILSHTALSGSVQMTQTKGDGVQTGGDRTCSLRPSTAGDGRHERSLGADGYENVRAVSDIHKLKSSPGGN